MIRINLLPPELRKKKRKRVVTFEPAQTLLVIIVVCELAACMGAYVAISMKAGKRQRELNSISAEIARLQKEVEYVTRLENNAKDLQQKVQIIDNLMFSRMLWSKKLNGLSNLLPENTWFTAFSISRPSGAGIILNLRGKILNPPGEKAVNLLGVLINNMKANLYFFENFSDVEFVSTSTTKEKEKEILNFELRLISR